MTERRFDERRKVPPVTREQMAVLVSKGLVTREMGEGYLALMKFRSDANDRRVERQVTPLIRRPADVGINPPIRRTG